MLSVLLCICISEEDVLEIQFSGPLCPCCGDGCLPVGLDLHAKDAFGRAAVAGKSVLYLLMLISPLSIFKSIGRGDSRNHFGPLSYLIVLEPVLRPSILQ